jgi:hypothetical protein
MRDFRVIQLDMHPLDRLPDHFLRGFQIGFFGLKEELERFHGSESGRLDLKPGDVVMGPD